MAGRPACGAIHIGRRQILLQLAKLAFVLGSGGKGGSKKENGEEEFGHSVWIMNPLVFYLYGSECRQS